MARLRDYYNNEVAPALMKKFEYKRVPCLYNEDRIEKLNQLGEEGWQLVSLIEYGTDNQSSYFYLMREVSN